MKLTAKEICIFALLGVVMFISKLIMEFLPNMHLLAMFITAFTVVYRKKALYPIYIFVFLLGLYNGFNTWWIPYLYIWTVLWALVMVLPKNMPRKAAVPVYILVCALHGLAYGTLYSPVHAILYSFSLKQMLAWIAVGFPWDVMHAVFNAFSALLVIPMVELLKKVNKTSH